MSWERYTIKNVDNRSYTFDKLIFSCSIILLLCIFIFFVFLNGGLSTEKNVYIYCNTTNAGTYAQPYCFNPVYKDYKICNDLWLGACEQEFLLNGFSYGTPPPKWFIFFNLITLIIMISAFIINHFVHNKDFNKRVE